MENELPPNSSPHRHRPMIVDYYARKAADEVHRIQQGFTRENTIQFLKTLAWVVPLTILIWAYAEQGQEIGKSDVPASIEIKSTDPSRTVTLLSPPEKTITCDLYGPQSSIDRVVDSLIPSNPLAIDIDQSIPLGEHEIETLPKIENDPRFKGLTVQKASPPFLLVYVDQVETREVPVEAPPGLLSLQNATFSPPTVKMTGPSQALDRIAKSNGHLSVIADIANLPMLNSPGQHAPVTVSLIPPDADGVSVAPQTVQATLNVKEADVTYTATNLPILLLAPNELMDKYRIAYDPPIYPAVNLVGPPDKIDQIAQHEVRPIAALQIDDDDVKNPRAKDLQILNLPPGVRLAPGENPQASFSVTER
jgi:YbbR-like protein